MVDRQHPSLSIVRQCWLLGISRSSLYYQPVSVSPQDLNLMRLLDQQYPSARLRAGSGHPFLRLPADDGVVAAAGVRSGSQAGAATDARHGTPGHLPAASDQPAPGHKVYPYLLRGLEINRVNQVWTADITYLPMQRGFMYPSATLRAGSGGHHGLA